VATIARPTATSTAADAEALVATGPEAVSAAVVNLSSGKISAEEFTRLLAGGQPVVPPAAVPEVTRLTVEAAWQALAEIPGQLTPAFTGTLKFVKTDWDGLFQRALSTPSTQQMLDQFRSLATQPAYHDSTRYKRPLTLAEIPSDMLDSRLANVPIDRREAFGLAMVDCVQTSWLSTNGVMLAIVAKSTRDPVQLAHVIEMLEELNKCDPLQRPGTTIWDPAVAVTAGGDGVWLATAWGISAIVDMSTVLGDDVPVDLRGRLDAQLRREVQRFCVDWRDARPWFVKSRYVVSNQWIEPSIALIKACLYLGDPALLPAYNLGVENLLASLNAHGQSGEFLEGVSYAQMTLRSTHEIIGKMRLMGDTRCLSTPFAANNWKWFAQQHMPGAMLVNCNDSGKSQLPDYAMSVPLSSFGSAAMASGDQQATAMMRFLYPAPRPIGALEALQYADFLASSPVAAAATLPTFAYFPAQELVTWRSEFQPVESAQTAFALWVKGGRSTENHVHREQGNVSVYCGNRIVLSNCGTPNYNAPDYASNYAGAAGSNILQVNQLTPSGQPVNAPLTVHVLDSAGGSVTLNTSAAYFNTTCTRDVSWDRLGKVRLDDKVTLIDPAPAGTEFYRFHTGSAEILTISGSNKSWRVVWLGTSMTINADQDIVVEQATLPDMVQSPFHHQTILISVPVATTSLQLTSELAVDRSITQ